LRTSTNDPGLDLARAYNKTKDTEKRVAVCCDCGKPHIKISGENCVAFGLYACLRCRIIRSKE